MEDALLRILTPRRSIDILRDVHAAKEQGKPYVVVFVGVNGVGKSTNLAKVKSVLVTNFPGLTYYHWSSGLIFNTIFFSMMHYRLHTGFYSIMSVS